MPPPDNENDTCFDGRNEPTYKHTVPQDVNDMACRAYEDLSWAEMTFCISRIKRFCF